jgi:hypothetical protein
LKGGAGTYGNVGRRSRIAGDQSFQTSQMANGSPPIQDRLTSATCTKQWGHKPQTQARVRTRPTAVSAVLTVGGSSLDLEVALDLAIDLDLRDTQNALKREQVNQ